MPVAPRAEWKEAKDFARGIAETMAKARPDRYVATMTKNIRRGRIFIDYLRNGRGSTAVSAYSPRAGASAAVSTSLAWDELSESIKSNHFGIGNLRHRLDAMKVDPWAELFAIEQTLPSQRR